MWYYFLCVGQNETLFVSRKKLYFINVDTHRVGDGGKTGYLEKKSKWMEKIFSCR